MKRILASLLVAALFTIVAFIGLTERSLPSASAQGQIRWEYAELSTSALSRAELVNTVTTTMARWEDPQTTVEGTNYSALAKKLGSNSNRQDSTALLNFVGGKGWELVNHSNSIAANGDRILESITWTFKRRR